MMAEGPNLFAAIVQDAPDAIIVADADGIIRFWNTGAQRIFGHAASEAVGHSLDLIIPEGLRARHWTGWRAVVASGQSRYGAGDLLAVPGRRRDGARISLEFTITLVHGADGRVAGMAAILRDVTERFEEMKALRRKLAAAERP
jgi:PAS domain S-box-containing protein